MLREGSDYLCARKSTGAFSRFCKGAILIALEFYQISDHNHAFAAKTIVLTDTRGVRITYFVLDAQKFCPRRTVSGKIRSSQMK
jgi:hypothetical protein